MARAKQTARSEARRRHRVATTQAAHEEAAEGEALDFGERRRGGADTAARGADRPAPRPGERLGFGAAFRAAYHPANLREDIRQLPQIVQTRSFLAAVGLVLAGAAAALIWPNYTGSLFAFQLLVLPGSSLGPQLVAGFFAPRASYLLGLLIGLLQGAVFVALFPVLSAQSGVDPATGTTGDILLISFVTGPIGSVLFASAAAWYKRFLALSSPRRADAGRAGNRGGSGRSARR